ncbi:RES family NAD+ phosphorylase [Serratia marcescens]|uniref:RES family NAD+ phosphorylase n=1 Tax=Serratia marcescens TaxID=615 RepID=UPI0029D5A988|nr:RES family NAD+ phosphorylase [Serratia marcescens]MDX7274354.1 RES family NAD+ phosphorylase [Serratia marcescens]
MAKRKARLPGDEGLQAPADEVEPAPPLPWEKLDTTSFTLKARTVLHRVHQARYKADQFNPGRVGNARFSPIQNADAEAIPTLYAGVTMACAMMETVFHDVPYAPGVKTLDKGKLSGQVHSMVEVTQDLQLTDLSSVPLRKLGVSRKQLIDTEKDQYPATRQWAEAIHRQSPESQGLSWISRQDDTARAMVLFGDRIPAKALSQQGDSRSLLDDTEAYDEVFDLAEQLGVLIVQGKA